MFQLKYLKDLNLNYPTVQVTSVVLDQNSQISSLNGFLKLIELDSVKDMLCFS